MRRVSVHLGVMAFSIAALTASAAVAGDNNQLYLIQQSPQGSLDGNLLNVDQADASNSLITGLHANSVGLLASHTLNLLNYDPLRAAQLGEGNVANIEMHGDGGEIQLLQAANPLAALFLGTVEANNTANITSTGNSLGTVIQVGLSNDASLNLGGDGSVGLITQLGNNQITSLNVAQNASGTVTQIGDNNDTGIVTVAPGVDLSYTQVGSNLSTVGADGVHVNTSTGGGNITITQYPW